MIIIPLMLGLAVLSGMRFIFLQDRRDRDNSLDFFHRMVRMRAFADSWNGDVSQIVTYMENF